ncbi:glycosyltransferase family 4 protein [Pseudomonas luteola]|uniref:Glycosyltransferase n=1 Tax=Pseudomonas luteola TaxID=47886 RepID=A0ABS0MPM6_PSELU|nr:glycosyltransferase [Pseudomonas luteola]MBH3438018.1 glycosyltransferase [Pseudomonas luteola]
MTNYPTLHQFSVTCSLDDGTASTLFLIQKLLQEAGISSEIYCENVPSALRDRVRSVTEYQSEPNQILLVHHRSGNPIGGWLKALPAQKVMILHDRLPSEQPVAVEAAPRDEQEIVRSLDEWLVGLITLSEKRYDALRKQRANTSKVIHIPLLMDVACSRLGSRERFDKPRPFTLLSNAKFASERSQHLLMEALEHVLRITQVPVELVLLQDDTDDRSQLALKDVIQKHGLEQAVTLTGNISSDTQQHYFQRSDLFVSLGEWDLFGFTFVEAMAHQLPIVAYASPQNNLEESIGDAALVLDTQEPEQCAATIAVLMENPTLRQYLVRRGNARLRSRSHQVLYDKFSRFMAQFGFTLPSHFFNEIECTPTNNIRIEGAFDSSYSLAVVNRELARAFAARSQRVALRATEGPGPIEVDPLFLQSNPDCAEWYERCEEPSENVLRLIYPPRTTDMHGQLNVMSCYGWEESRLPEQACRDFNHYLGLVTTMSSYVTRILEENGVNVPLATVGIGVDHILRHSPDTSLLPKLSSVTDDRLCLLHISSCFPRKGVDCLLKAYGNVFTAKDAVVLVIKTFPNPHHDIESQLAQWRASLVSPPSIELINMDLPDKAIRALYDQAHVLVAPSRGEGFGLPMAEAMLHRVPVITTGYGGQRDFCTNETSWLIDYRFARAQTHMQLTGSLWVEPSAEHLSRLLQDFYSARQEHRWEAFTQARVNAAEQLIRSRFTWSQVAERTANAISTAHQQPLLKPRPKLAIVSTWNSACGIAAYSQKLVSPALSDCLVLANDDAALTETDGPNVIRCWTAGGSTPLDRLIQVLDEHVIDQLLIQFNFGFFQMDAFRKLLREAHQRGIQTLVTFHSTADVERDGQLKSLRSLREELSLCKRLMVHAVSDLNRLLDFGLAENAMLFPHGVMPIAEVEPGPAQLASGLQHKRVIASYGFLLPHKGIYQLIDAFALLAKQQPDLHLLLVNAIYPVQLSADEAERCRAHAVELGLESRITFVTDYLEDADSLAWLSLADVIVFPYQHTQESSSAAVRWGLCAGKPVLCTPLTIFEDVEEAVITLPGTAPADMAKGLSEYFAHPEAPRQQAWLKANAWPSISRRLQGLLTALHWEQLAKH